MLLQPVFAGRTESGDLYILYKGEDDLLEYIPPSKALKNYKPEEYHLKLPNGELWALAPGSQLTTWEGEGNDLNHMHLKIQSEVWTGELRGSRLDFVEAQVLGPPR